MSKKVVIVGAGFGGLSVARGLADKKGFEVTIIDKKNHHLFQPLLYQVAMAGLSPADIAVPIRGVFGGTKNVRVLMAEAESVDLKEQKVKGTFGELEYDYLVLACGSEQSYFGNDKWKPLAPGLKSLQEATEIRRRLLCAFERAEREPDPQKRQELQTFVVVGGGPTGVELAGAIGEISRYTLRDEFTNMDPQKTKIYLLEGGARILPSFDEKLSRRATKDLQSLGVEVRTNSLAKEITKEGVQVGEEFIPAKTVLWAAGVRSPAINKALEKVGVSLDSKGRVIVSKDLSIPNANNVFVLGDQACFEDESGNALPGLAPVAFQQGWFLAKLLIKEVKGSPRSEFTYRDKDNDYR